MQRTAATSTTPTRFDNTPSVPGFKVEKRDNQHYELQLHGSFTLGWLARLAAGLSDHQISIVRGNGKLIKASYWEAKFDIKSDSKTRDPSKIDYFSLMEADALTSGSGTLELIGYSIQSSETNNNAVWVEIQGADKIGFLCNLLKIFSFNSLFPCAIEIGTTGTNVSDRFLLRGIAGAPPSRNALKGLEEQLDDYIVS